MLFSKNTDPLCPDFQAPCKKHGCIAYGIITGNNPRTGESKEEYGCYKYQYSPIIQLESARRINQMAGALEQMRDSFQAIFIELKSNVERILSHKIAVDMLTAPQAGSFDIQVKNNGVHFDELQS